MEKSYSNAFCVVRPPGMRVGMCMLSSLLANDFCYASGHHAGRCGLVSSAPSQGFCFFNNVAIGVKYALLKHSSVVRKVVVFDFDLHHGEQQ